ncbi:Rv1733c family protein [Streptomyces olivaceiscleroticus]|uniref:Uncharacterized protein n=1 Tax=Streptomyces olivaceiscleroticus TaxID=68245 RepID=A0ABN0ZYT0_9ACTN
MGTKKWMWRWRSSPLRRPSDVLESLVVLLAVLLVLLGTPTVAVMASRAAQDTVQEQRRDRHSATAVLVEDAPEQAPATGYSGADNDKVSVAVRWRDTQGSVRTGTAPSEPGRKAGTAVAIWLDDRGRLTKQPLGSVDGAVTVGMTGIAAALGWSVAVLSAAWGTRLGLDRWRARQWGREWAQVGPQWGQKQK